MFTLAYVAGIHSLHDVVRKQESQLNSSAFGHMYGVLLLKMYDILINRHTTLLQVKKTKKTPNIVRHVFYELLCFIAPI